MTPVYEADYLGLIVAEDAGTKVLWDDIGGCSHRVARAHEWRKESRQPEIP